MYDKLQQIRQQKQDEDRGFTLIELLVVVVIIGILIAIAIPLYLNYQKGAKDKSAQSDLRAAVATVNQCYTDGSNTYPAAPTGNNTASTDLVFTCGTLSETAKASDGTTMNYTQVKDANNNVTGFQITSTNSGGNNKTYTYNSTTSGKIS